MALPDRAIALFLQGPSQPVARARLCTEIDMVERVLAASAGAPVLVKPHPRNHDRPTRERLAVLAGTHVNLHVVEAHIHDMLAVAAATCSISSGVSLEGYLHRVPALIFGKVDFHHIARTVHAGEDVGAALDWARAQGPGLPYAAYLHWFLQKNCINIGRDDWFARTCARVRTP